MRTRGIVSVAIAATLFGTAGVARVLGPDDLSSLSVGAWRTAIGGAGLVAVAGLSGRGPWRHRWRWSALLGGIAVIAYQIAFFAAVDKVGVAAATVVSIGTGPIVAGLLDRLLRGRRLDGRWFAGVVIAVAGIAALTSGGVVGGDPVGWLFAIAAGTGFPLYGLVAQDLMEDRPPLAAISLVFGVGALIALPLALVAGGVDTFGDAALVAYLGLVATALAYALWAVGLRVLPLRDTVTITLVEPVAATTLAAIVLSEPLTISSAVAMAAIILGVAVATIPGRQRPLLPPV